MEGFGCELRGGQRRLAGVLERRQRAAGGGLGFGVSGFGLEV